MSIAVTGVAQMRQVGLDLRAAPARMRSRMRREIVGATSPITAEARVGFGGYGGLGADLAAATTTRVRTAGRAVGVSVLIDAKKLPADKQGLPPLVEGLQPWRHPRWGQLPWYSQDARPELGPAVEHHLPGVEVAVITAVEQTAQALARGSA